KRRNPLLSEAATASSSCSQSPCSRLRAGRCDWALRSIKMFPSIAGRCGNESSLAPAKESVDEAPWHLVRDEALNSVMRIVLEGTHQADSAKLGRSYLRPYVKPRQEPCQRKTVRIHCR